MRERSRKTEAQKNASSETEVQKNVRTGTQEYSLLGESWADTSQAAGSKASDGMEKLENYNYFDADRIEKSMKIPRRVMDRGRKLRTQGKVTISNILTGFDSYSGENLVQVDAVGQESENPENEFPMRMIFSRTEMVSRSCNCPACSRSYWNWSGRGEIECGYMAAMAGMMVDYLKTHSPADATDQKGMALIYAFREKRENMLLSGGEAKQESLKLLPRLTRTEDGLSLSFRVGSGRMFVVKKLDEFCDNVKNSATAVYGSSTEFNHNLNNFTEDAKRWIAYLNQIVREEEQFNRRIQESRYYYGYKKESVGSSLDLFGWRLDQFYDHLGEEGVEYEDKRNGKRKSILHCGIHNPEISMQIQENRLEKVKGFHGVHVTGTVPELFYGMNSAYYVDEDHLYRTEPGFLEKVEPLAQLSGKTYGETFSFDVGRNHLAEFYYRILPQLQGIVKIEETKPEIFRSYLPPEVYFIFYLDAENDNFTCKIHAVYGDRETEVLDVLSPEHGGMLEPFRDKERESEILYLTSKWFPETDYEKGELHCGHDEEIMYRVMESGTAALMELGEVRCTKRFREQHVVRKVKVSVGVSVSGGLLDLNIATEDISPKELLDILKSYRSKKKYYRLESGEFLDMEDNSLEMLSEMMESLHLSPKEFIKGKMHLPVYRTLYLDKMLEENDAVYSHRDSHFREIVKEFKTVNDADFEVPESLSKIMRKYQKNGFKWLRTLESWKFGGILADDMGLGKTLQMIAVLLAAKQEGKLGTAMAAKQEGKPGTALVVTPASLVFNWGEEFGRFAPELSVTLVTGNQEERRRKIEAYEESDVLVTSYDLLKRDIALYEGKTFAYEVIDEAQYIKNHTTAAAKAVKVISSEIRFALTGTPIENRLSELWSIFDYLMPGFLYGYDVFKKEMESPIVKNTDEEAMKRLQKMTSPFILRRLKENVLKDLPDKLEESRYIQFGAAQQKLYDGQVLHMQEQIAKQDESEFNKNKLQILAELTRLRQICCDPSLCFENYRGEAAKVEACMDLIRSAMDGGHRILLFSQFTSMLEILKEQLEKEKIPCYTITGDTPKQKRLQLVKEFNEGDTPVFLISLKAGGVGLNLTGADVVIHYDPWWNLAAQNQATDRAHRIGQTKKVTVYKLIMKNSIEEKIQKLQETKRDLAEQVIGGETGQLGGLSRDELLELIL